MVHGVRSTMFVHTVDTAFSAGAVPENLWVAGRLEAFSSGMTRPPLAMYVHGASQFGPDAMISPNGPETTLMLTKLAEHFLVCFADLGSMSVGDRWGGPDHVLRILELHSYMNSAYGTSGKIALVGESMGALAALNYAKSYPTLVASVCAMIPVLDLDDFRTRMSAQAAIDPCYPPSGYSQATHGALYNPMTHASTLPSQEVMPIKLFYSTTDSAIPTSYITNYQAQRPATQAMDCGTNGHTEATIAIGADEVVRFSRFGNSSAS